MSQAFFQSHVAAGSKKTLYQTSRSSRGQLKRKSAGKTSSWEGRPTSPSMTKMIGSTYHIARNRSFGYRRFWLTSIISHSPALFSQGTSGSCILINFVTKISNFKWISALFQPEGRKNSTMTPRTDQLEKKVCDYSGYSYIKQVAIPIWARDGQVKFSAAQVRVTRKYFNQSCFNPAVFHDKFSTFEFIESA